MSDDDPANWERLEEWLVEHEGEEFTSISLAKNMGIYTGTATGLIQSYLLAQRSSKSETLYLLKRKGRTRAARWSFGKRVLDAQALDVELFRDIVVKVNRNWMPDVRHLTELNPKLAKRYERKVEALMGGALVMLRTVLDDAIASEEGG